MILSIFKNSILLCIFFVLIGGDLYAQSIDFIEVEARIASAKSDSAKGSICHKTSIRLFDKDNIKGISYANRSLQYYKKAKNAKGQGLALQMLAFLQMYTGETKTAHQTALKSINILAQNGYFKETMPSYSAASYCLEKDGRYDEALSLILESLDLIDNNGISKAQRAKNMVDLARIYRQTNQIDKSLEVYRNALAISQKEDDHATSGVIYMNMGNVYVQDGRYDRALESFYKGLPETRECKCNGRMNQLWRNIGFAHYHLGDQKKLKEALDSSVKTLLDTTNLEASADVEILRGGLFQLQGNHNEAVSHLEKALAISRKNDYKEKIIQVASLLEKSYAALGDKDKLASILATSMAIKDSAFTEKMAESVAEMQIKYESDKKQKELDRITTENELKETFIQKIKTRNTLLGLLLIVSFLLTIGAFYLYKKNNNTASLLRDKNEELQVLIDQKSLLLKEIHHRVKNNLQTVSSLLSLQTRASKDESVKKAIGIGQSRLKSISLLHQKLYQRDALEKVEMEEYVEDLSSYIIKNFNYEDKNIELKTYAPEIALDLDTAIPIGLIINELITNSIKHSFANVEDCSIVVELKKADKPSAYRLEITTNGSGLPKNLEIEKLSSTGLKLVLSLSRQLQGSFEAYEDEKAHFIVNFKEEIV